MKRIITSVITGVSVLAMAGVGLVGATSANAYTGAPPWAPGDPAAKGAISFFDANGGRITGGADINNIASYVAVSTAGRANATKATLLVAAPDPANATVSTWAVAEAQGNYVWKPAPGGVPNAVKGDNTKPFITLDTAGKAIKDVASGVSLYSGSDAAYKYTLELRIQDSGVGVVSDGGQYWRTVIQYNPTNATYDSLAPNAWRVLYPAVTNTVPVVSAPTANPSSPVYQGTSVTFSTTVSGVSAGTVRFWDGVPGTGVQIGSDKTVTVDGGTVTSDATTSLSRSGSYTDHAIYAQYIPVDYAAVDGVTSSALTFRVNKSPAAATTTTLSLDATSVQQPNAASGSAVVTKDADSSVVTAGTVTFKDGANTISTDSSAPYTFSVSSSALSTGAHTMTAVFTPTDATDFVASTSGEATLTVTAPAYEAADANLSTSIAAGTIVLTTSYTAGSPLVLPAMTLDANATYYSTSAALAGLQVADTRAGNLPYTVSAQAFDLVKDGVVSPSVNQRIDAQNVGLSNITKTSSNVTPNTFNVNQVNGTTPDDSYNVWTINNNAASFVPADDTGSLGLGGSAPHSVIHANHGLGTSVFAGQVTIKAPTNTVAGTYVGKITFTVVGS